MCDFISSETGVQKCSENLSIIVSMPERFIDFQTPRYISLTHDDDDDVENKKKS